MDSKHLFIISAIFGVDAALSYCHVCFEGACYSRAPIFRGRLTGQIAIDRIGNIVYYHYENSQSIDYTAAYDLDDIRFKLIPDIDFSFARAVDQSTRDVYIGGVQGIFKYNPVSNKTTNFGINDKTIWHMQYKSNIYYTIFTTKGLFKYENKKSKGVPALSNYSIDDFVIGKNNDLYFMSDSRVYRLKRNANQTSVVANEMYFLSIDKFNDVYFIHPVNRGIYKMHHKTDKLVEIGVFDSGLPFKVVFDANNNIVYYDKEYETLYYLTPNFGRCKVTRARGKKHKSTSNNNNNKKVKLSIQQIN